MASNKRTVIELSSGSDDDNPLVNRRRKIRRQAQPQREADPEQMRHKAREFLEFLDSALPRSLFACDVADYIQRESNIRLALATEQGVSLENISIGRDCLPTWPEMQWDPEKESLHCAIQNRLLDLEVSNVLGNALRGVLRAKAKQKLEEARQLGLRLEDITIGPGLLATWDSPAPEL